MTLYKNNKKLLRIRDVTHLISLKDKVYLFGEVSYYTPAKSIIEHTMYDTCICELFYDSNYRFFQNLVRDLKNGKSGKYLSRKIENTFNKYQIDFLPKNFKLWIDFLLTHYNYDRYYLTETMSFRKSSKKYLRVEMKLKERGKR
ncbi:hypothetical protein KQI68_07170 [Peptoniphilus sp. MSJ-1]|uniref:Uncharacterized protein n=1 Tax=Peptoniphilus ovalis TaxID=2841503 RepID=A0ABS6FHY6_9FIRM|nr:hypothetical protein [Peptoniphilus ovalis]MBU5669619.1 hypothetical protein [Peptoniphilus ovalis]